MSTFLWSALIMLCHPCKRTTMTISQRRSTNGNAPSAKTDCIIGSRDGDELIMPSATHVLVIINDGHTALEAGRERTPAFPARPESLNVEGIHFLPTGEMENTEALGAFLDLPLPRWQGHKNLDLGGGSLNGSTAWLRENWGVENRVHDIYARDPEHNLAVEREMFAGNSPSVTSCSVLNVIREEDERKQHIQTAFDALVPGGRAYFKVYKGDGSKVAEQKKHENFFQHNQPASYFMAEILAIFHNEGDHVELEEEKNLITATKGPQEGSVRGFKLWPFLSEHGRNQSHILAGQKVVINIEQQRDVEEQLLLPYELKMRNLNRRI